MSGSAPSYEPSSGSSPGSRKCKCLIPAELFLFELSGTYAFMILTYAYRKFGKQIQRRQLDLPEYAASFVNYKSLKKVGDPEPSSLSVPANAIAAH